MPSDIVDVDGLERELGRLQAVVVAGAAGT
jgi:hypothetical protein